MEFEGVSLIVKSFCEPLSSVMFLFIDIDDTEDVSLTVTVQDADKPFSVYTVIVVVPDDTPVIKVEMDRSGVIFHYYPQALKPIVTREYIQKHYPEFSKKIECYIKRNMENRVETDKDFIKALFVCDTLFLWN